ncbi:rhodanese-like domain-containing protein [Dokdonia sp. LLG6352-1]|uniref:rhodanese-like domain-containing protein n=1 Tax=Dokdonia sp. LLG6352-1 TaxID=3160831 RepID=UPI0038700E12
MRKKVTHICSVIAIMMMALSCNQATSQQASPEASVSEVQEQKIVINRISPDELETAMSAQEIQLVDVRTDREWESGHIKGAKHFEMNNVNWQSQLETLDKEEPVYVYCAKGGRSARCAKQLEEAGFTTIYDLKGGLTSWKASGKTVE